MPSDLNKLSSSRIKRTHKWKNAMEVDENAMTGQHRLRSNPRSFIIGCNVQLRHAPDPCCLGGREIS
jgi:hypothetical protein